MDILDELKVSVEKLDDIAKSINNKSPESIRYMRQVVLMIEMLFIALGKSKKEHGSDFPIFSDDASWENFKSYVYRTSIVMINVTVSLGFESILNNIPYGSKRKRYEGRVQFLAKQIPDKSRQTEFKNFFLALRALRHKCAHANSKLEDSDLKKLRSADLSSLVSKNNEVLMRPNNIIQLLTQTLKLLKACENSNT